MLFRSYKSKNKCGCKIIDSALVAVFLNENENNEIKNIDQKGIKEKSDGEIKFFHVISLNSLKDVRRTFALSDNFIFIVGQLYNSGKFGWNISAVNKQVYHVKPFRFIFLGVVEIPSLFA